MNQIRSASLLASFTIALAVGVPAPAQTIPPDAYGALRWRLIGPHRGGRVLAVAGVPGDAATFYFGAVGGGVWRTRNAGVTWGPPLSGRTRPIPRLYTPRSTRRAARRGSSTPRTKDRGAACTSRPTAVPRGLSWAARVFPPVRSAASVSRPAAADGSMR